MSASHWQQLFCPHCHAMMLPLSPQGLSQLFLLPSTLLWVIRLCHHPLAQGHAAGQDFADLAHCTSPGSVSLDPSPSKGKHPTAAELLVVAVAKSIFGAKSLAGRHCSPGKLSLHFPIPWDISQHVHWAPKQEFLLGDAATCICHFHASSWQGSC